MSCEPLPAASAAASAGRALRPDKLFSEPQPARPTADTNLLMRIPFTVDGQVVWCGLGPIAADSTAKSGVPQTFAPQRTGFHCGTALIELPRAGGAGGPPNQRPRSRSCAITPITRPARAPWSAGRAESAGPGGSESENQAAPAPHLVGHPAVTSRPPATPAWPKPKAQPAQAQPAGPGEPWAG